MRENPSAVSFSSSVCCRRCREPRGLANRHVRRCHCGAPAVRASGVPDNSKRAERVHPKDVSCTSTSGADVIPRVYPENRTHVACAQSIATFATCAICHQRKKYACLPLSLSVSPSFVYLSISLFVCIIPFSSFHICSFALEREAQSPVTAKTAGNLSSFVTHCAWNDEDREHARCIHFFVQFVRIFRKLDFLEDRFVRARAKFITR